MNNDDNGGSEPISMADKRSAFVPPGGPAHLLDDAFVNNEKPKPDMCSVQRTVGAVLVPQASVQFNPKTRQPEQVTNFVMQFIANETHEWRMGDPSAMKPFFCIHCRNAR